MSKAELGLPDRFAWLFGQAAPPSGALRDQDEFTAAWKVLRDNWQVLPITGPKLLAWASPALRKHADAQALRDRMVSVRTFAKVQLQVCDRFVRALHAAGVPYVLLKGSAVRYTAYEDPTSRCGKDIDLVTTRPFLARAEQVALAIGFIPSQWNAAEKRFHRADLARRAEVEAEHYELGFLVRRQTVDGISAEDEAAIRRDMPTHYLWHETDDGRLACYVSTDIHHALSLDLPSEPVLETAVSIDTPSGRVTVAAPAWYALHVIFTLYWEGVHTYNKGLYQFTDLLLHVRRMSPADIERLLLLMADLRLEVAGYYVLRRLETDFHETLAPQLGEFLEALALAPEGDELDAKAFNDLGDMWPKIWGYR